MWGPKIQVRFWWDPPPYDDAWWQCALRRLLRKQIARMEADEAERHRIRRAEFRRSLRACRSDDGLKE